MKNNSLNGVINVYKEKDFTSHDVVAIVRRSFSEVIGEKIKVGHTGTLDPNATGVLPICIGRATKFSNMIMDGNKTYKCKLFLGFSTTSYDTTGDKVETSSKKVTKDEIEKAIKRYVGVIDQVPPMVSAVKVNGQKLYDLARKGIEVERKPRRVEIFNIDIQDINEEEQSAVFTVECSKGTYIRSLCNDIGLDLGTFGAMGDLERVKSASFSIDTAVKISEIREVKTLDDVHNLVMPIENMLQFATRLDISDKAIKFVNNGNPLGKKFVLNDVDFSTFSENDLFKLYLDDNFIGLYELRNGILYAKIVYDLLAD